MTQICPKGLKAAISQYHHRNVGGQRNDEVWMADAIRSYMQTRQAAVTHLSNGPITMDLVRHEVSVGGELIWLPPKRFALLRYFLEHAGEALPSQQILHAVWGAAHGDYIQYLRVFVSHLKRDIGRHVEVQLIHNIKGHGYMMKCLPEAA